MISDTELNILFGQAINKWGKDSQLDMVIEECAELINAIQKLRRNRVSAISVVEEIVDVDLCLQCMKVLYSDYKEEFEIERYHKIERFIRRLNNEQTKKTNQ